MDKEQKAAAVAELSDRLKEAESIFAVDYRGISVTGAAELRAKLREADAVFKVVKNRLAKRAVSDAGADELEGLLEGPTALTLIKGDPVTAAKAISTFAREHEVLVYKGGVMDGEPLDADAFAAIARLPGLEVLHGQLVGVTASPLTGLVRGLGSLMSGLAVALGQIAEQGLVSGEEPTPEEPTADEPAEEEAAAAEAAEPAGDEGAAEEAEAEQPEPEAESAPEPSEETSEETETETEGEQEPSDESEE
jgi:large subunit ribosomal protein L10